MKLFVTCFFVFLSCVAGNFFYEVMTHREWGEAVERSYFQIIAVAWFAFVIWWTARSA